MRIKSFIIILVLLSIINFYCRSGYIKTFIIFPETQIEKDYIEKVWATPLEFRVPNNKEEIIWGRIQSFIGKYSSVKIQVATDYVVQTYNADYGQFGYYVTRTPDISETSFSIRCITNPKPEKLWSGEYDYSQQAELNAHILAHYALTNELMPKFIKQ